MASPIAIRWFVERQSGVRGPSTGDKLQALAQQGEIKPDDFIRQGIDGRPIPASTVEGLFPSVPILSDKPPAKPTPPSSVADQASVDVPPAQIAALLTAKRAERLQLTEVSLPQLFLDLGKAIHSAQQSRNAFPALCARIDESFQRIRELKTARSTDKTVGLSARAKMVATTARNAPAAKAAFRKLADQFRSLGQAAYEKDGPSSGPASLTSAIAAQQRQIETLDAEIAALDQPSAGRALLPRRMLVSAVCALGLVLPLCWASRHGDVASSRGLVTPHNPAPGEIIPRMDAARTMPDNSRSPYTAADLEELAAMARSGIAESRMLKLRWQRGAANYASLAKEVNDFKNGTIGCPKHWIDLHRMWKGRYKCLEAVPVHVIQVTGPDEFLAEGFSAENFGKRVILRGWDTSGFVDGQRRSLSGVGYAGGATATYGSVLGGLRAGLIEKVPDEIERYVLDSLLKPAPK